MILTVQNEGSEPPILGEPRLVSVEYTSTKVCGEAGYLTYFGVIIIIIQLALGYSVFGTLLEETLGVWECLHFLFIL